MHYNSIASKQNILLLSSSQCFVSFVIVYRRYCLCNSQTIPSEHYVSCNKDLKKKIIIIQHREEAELICNEEYIILIIIKKKKNIENIQNTKELG